MSEAARNMLGSFWKATNRVPTPGVIKRHSRRSSAPPATTKPPAAASPAHNNALNSTTTADTDQPNTTASTSTSTSNLPPLSELSVSPTATQENTEGTDIDDGKNVDAVPDPTPTDVGSPRRNLKLEKFKAMLNEPNLDTDKLRAASWNGVPDAERGTTWKLLLGYLPTNKSRREPTYSNRRQLYDSYCDQYHKMEETEENEVLLKQIRVDVPRMGPGVPWIQSPRIQGSLERILYIWAIRHPASGYVQGINDLAVPFYLAYIAEHGNIAVADQAGMEELVTNTELLSEVAFKAIEADCFWSVSTLLDGIQDHYTFAQPGIQRLVFKLNKLIHTIDEQLHGHLEKQGVEFLLFAFRWMQCLLMRELSLPLVIRLWDTLLAQEEGFKTFHVYVCAAFLMRFAPRLKEMEFQDLVLFLQNVPTAEWSTDDITRLLGEAYIYYTHYHESPSHLR